MIMDKEEPIYKFEGLKRLLTSKGYIVEEAKGYREIENVEVELDDVRNKMEFTDEGIFLNDDVTNSRQQIFLYKRDYHLSAYDKKKPRYHTHKCKTIQEFIDSGRFHDYRRANTDVVMVRDMDDRYKDKEVYNLPLCLNCAKMAIKFQGKNSSEFVELLKQAKDAEAPQKKRQRLTYSDIPRIGKKSAGNSVNPTITHVKNVALLLKIHLIGNSFKYTI